MTDEIDVPYIDTISDIPHEERLEELDPFWLYIFSEHQLYRFIYIDQGSAGDSYKGYDSRDIKYTLHRPILLINGYKSSHTTWNWLVQQLWANGFRNIFALELKNYNVGLDPLYAQLNFAIEKILETFGGTYTHVSVIAHSLGGIISRYYIKNHEYTKGKGIPNIGLCITLATPHYGLLAPLRRFKKFEDFIKRLIDPETVEIFSNKSGIYDSILEKSQEKDFYYVTMVNLQGSLKRYAGTDGTFSPKPVPDMINIVIPVGHFRINKDEISSEIILTFLSKRVSIYKVRLVFIEFFEKLNGDFLLYIEIKRNDELQRYPIGYDLDIKQDQITEGLVPNQTEIIYMNYVNLDEQKNELLTFELYKRSSEKSKSILISTNQFKFKLGKDKPFYDFFTLSSDELNVYLSVLSHSVIKEGYYSQ